MSDGDAFQPGKVFDSIVRQRGDRSEQHDVSIMPPRLPLGYDRRHVIDVVVVTQKKQGFHHVFSRTRAAPQGAAL